MHPTCPVSASRPSSAGGSVVLQPLRPLDVPRACSGAAASASTALAPRGATASTAHEPRAATAPAAPAPRAAAVHASRIVARPHAAAAPVSAKRKLTFAAAGSPERDECVAAPPPKRRLGGADLDRILSQSALEGTARADPRRGVSSTATQGRASEPFRQLHRDVLESAAVKAVRRSGADRPDFLGLRGAARAGAAKGAQASSSGALRGASAAPAATAQLITAPAAPADASMLHKATAAADAPTAAQRAAPAQPPGPVLLTDLCLRQSSAAHVRAKAAMAAAAAAKGAPRAPLAPRTANCDGASTSGACRGGGAHLSRALPSPTPSYPPQAPR